MNRRSKGPDRVELPCGLPMSICFSEKDVEAAIEAPGTVSYILGAKPGATANAMGTVQVFKLVKNIVGVAVVPVKDDDLDLAFLDQQCWFNLPAIPLKMVADLDKFFRLIDDKLGTESIALLTFDPSYLNQENASDGWGVLIPKQTNTAGSCKYDPASVAEKKEDGVMIVGSAHSHPGMKAFASHTDVGDQANFDGIHITYGWDKGSKKTEYHIELQMAGTRFTYKPEQAFEQEPDTPVPDEVLEWAECVEKEVPQFKKIWIKGGQYGVQTSIEIPNTLPNPADAGVIVDMLAGENKCPCCDTWLHKDDKDRRRCHTCQIFLALPGEDISDIIIERGKNKPPYETSELNPKQATADAWHWKRELKDNKEFYSTEKLFEATAENKKKVGGSGKA